MEERGEAYVTMMKPAAKKPMDATRASPLNASRVNKIAPTKNPTFKVPTISAILTCKLQLRGEKTKTIVSVKRP